MDAEEEYQDQPTNPDLRLPVANIATGVTRLLSERWLPDFPDAVQEAAGRHPHDLLNHTISESVGNGKFDDEAPKPFIITPKQLVVIASDDGLPGEDRMNGVMLAFAEPKSSSQTAELLRRLNAMALVLQHTSVGKDGDVQLSPKPFAQPPEAYVSTGGGNFKTGAQENHVIIELRDTDSETLIRHLDGLEHSMDFLERSIEARKKGEPLPHPEESRILSYVDAASAAEKPLIVDACPDSHLDGADVKSAGSVYVNWATQEGVASKISNPKNPLGRVG